jgi:hypothetical protein
MRKNFLNFSERIMIYITGDTHGDLSHFKDPKAPGGERYCHRLRRLWLSLEPQRPQGKAQPGVAEKAQVHHLLFRRRA